MIADFVVALAARRSRCSPRLPAGPSPPARSRADSPARGSIVEDRAARKLLEAGDCPLRGRRGHQGGRGLAVGHRTLSAQPRPLRGPPAAGQLPARPASGPTTGPASTSKRSPPKRTATKSSGPRPRSRWASASIEARNYGKMLSGDAGRDREVPGQPAGERGLLLHRPGPLPAGHYSRAIEALEKVGTALTGEAGKVEKVEAGKRLFLKIEDADLAGWSRTRR